jgi:hypothetical protein
MPRRSLRPHLNQIRAWVRQGRTDAWIAHQLEVSVRDIEQFKRQNELVSDEEPQNGASVTDYPEEIDLRAEDDALIAAELEAADAEAERERAEAERARAEADDDDDDDAEEPSAPRRRRSRRGGRGRSRSPGRGAPLRRWKGPSITARRATACGSTPPFRRTRSTPSTGRATARSKSPWSPTGS